MTPDLSELVRTIPNLIRTGKIAEINADKVRLRLSPSLLTTWLQWIALRAGDVIDWCPPSIGEQVIVFSPNGDLTQGKVLAGLFSADSSAPQTSLKIRSIHYPDGAVVLYDFGKHSLSAILPAGSSALVKADAVTADAPQTTCTGDVTIKGNLVVEGFSALNNGAKVLGGDGGAAIVIDGDVTATGDIKAGDISLRNHPHGEIKRGDEKSGVPLP
ncbi:phage baseplate assembly protein V [Herbaspirillum huttiense]|uniref:Phage baseplate assembly protein V n=1 Tax=Herbaspirillum huttiense subsp. lycopersici TaxID=3074428 RepID=A0ABU2EQU0_9BURK|nr:phage baseplate assembly protein V [Herbaspirillum huttiense]MDR9850203.1 phage baseplate assembly protein V [Herbaspirillum huttiense SE1]